MEITTTGSNWIFEEDDGAPTPPAVVRLMLHYGERFHLLQMPLQITTSRRVFGRWLGRRIPSSYGGAYVYLTHAKTHAILINLERIDHSQERALEVVIAEELLHMRDWLDGDRRRHAKHGYDRIAHRVAEYTGATLEEVRSALIPVQQREYRYIYACPQCGKTIRRKRTGRWACRSCYDRTGRHYQLQVIQEITPCPSDLQ